MNEVQTQETWKVLQVLGFKFDEEVTHFNGKPGLSFDFGNFKMSALFGMNSSMAEVIWLTGTLKENPRRIGDTHFQMPLRISSPDQCAAWIVWNLDRSYSHVPSREVKWVTDGRQKKHLLPWVADLIAFEQRPQCTVQRDWMRLALKTLSSHLASVGDESLVRVTFGGGMLSIRSAQHLIVVPAEGISWPQHITIAAGLLRRLPKRLMRERIEVSVWESQLDIGGWRYTGITEAADKETVRQADQV